MSQRMSEPWETALSPTGRPGAARRAEVLRAEVLGWTPPTTAAPPRPRAAARRARGLITELDLDAADGPPIVLPEPSEVLALVRLHRRTLGVLDLRVPAGTILPAELRRAAVMQFGAAIAEHVRRDRESAGPPWRILDPAPACFQRRAEVLADPPPISVIVGAHWHPAGLERCLASLAALDYPVHEALVVDRGPHTRAVRQVVERADGRVRYLHCARPGVVAAHRLGAAAADGRILAFTDDGSVADRDWLAAIAEAFADTGVGLATGLVMPTWAGRPGSVPNLACTAEDFAQHGSARSKRRTVYVPDALVWYEARARARIEAAG